MEINWSIVVSIASLAITVFTIVYSNAKNQEHTNSRIDVVQNDIKHLSDKVEKHNKVIERVYELEGKADVFEQQIKVEQHRMDDAESDIRKINDRMTRRNAV